MANSLEHEGVLYLRPKGRSLTPLDDKKLEESETFAGMVRSIRSVLKKYIHEKTA